MELTDKVLDEYLELQEESKAILKRIDEIREALKEKGSFATYNFVCTVWEQERTGIAGLKEVTSAIGMEILMENDLIRTSRFLMVKVAKIVIKSKKIVKNA